MRLNFKDYKAGILVSVIGLAWFATYQVLSLIWDHGIFRGVGPSAIIIILLFVYDKWLWRFPFFNLMVDIPDLNGIYRGEVQFKFQDEDGSKPCSMQIFQTASHIKVVCQFSDDQESNTRSTSTEAFISTDESGDYRLCFYYHNRGSCKSGDTLDQHDGMNVLEVSKAPDGLVLEGYYFTNRNPQTMGCMRVEKFTEGEKQ